jgi:hypothetical protein
MSLFDKIKQHIAGATVTHKTRFDTLISLKNDFELSQEFINEWIIPYYMEVGRRNDYLWIDSFKKIKQKITPEIIEKSLGDFNWRTRKMGAYFSAITNHTEYIEPIGTHLLKSEVTYAGSIYCIVLAYFNTDECVDYLNTYLKYYLDKPDLWFDQRDAMQAIAYLDKINNTKHLEQHWDNWLKFISNKPYWEKEIITEHLEEQIAILKSMGEN